MATGQDIIDRARKTLCDPAKVHWPDEELVCYLDEALCELGGLAPQEFVERRSIPLVPGRCQQVPEGCIDLVAVEGTVVDGVKTDDPITEEKSSAGARLGSKYSCAVDGGPGTDADPCSLYRAGSYQITPASHGLFYIRPPVPETCAGIEITALVYCPPPELTDASLDVDLPCRAHAQLVDWVLMRAFEKDIESAASMARAGYHRSAFYDGLGRDYAAATRLRTGAILGAEGFGSQQDMRRANARGMT